MTTARKPVPRWYTITAIIAIAWNLLGVAFFVMQLMMTPEMLEQLPAAERELQESMPLWVLVSFGVATIGGLLGSIGLALRKVWCLLFLWLSLFAVLAQYAYFFLVANALALLGLQALVMPLLVVAVAIILVMMARSANTRHWLH